MARYLAAVFTDLERHSLVWSRRPRDVMIALIAEYRYLAEYLASQYGSSYQNFTGDGHLFLFETADAAVQFGLKLISAWKQSSTSLPAPQGAPHMALRLGCHFGECVKLGHSEDWVGRAINLAKRVEDAAEPDSLYVTENILELVDLPLYQYLEAGSHVLKGDHLPLRTLYRVTGLDEAYQAERPTEQLDAQGWFLKAAAFIGTALENSRDEEACYREALRLQPNYPEAHNNLAILLRIRGDQTRAAEHYREALRLKPEYPEAHYNYAILLESRGSVSAAVGHYREALRLRPEYVDAYSSLANLLKERSEIEEAERHYRNALRLRPGYVEVHNNYAILLELKGDMARAQKHYEQALDLRPNYKEAHYNYALFLESIGHNEGAKKRYREALRLWPDFPEAHNNLAALLHIEGDLDGAETHYRAALRLRPDDPETHYNFALCLKARGDAAAEEHFRLAYELAPDVPRFRSAIEPPA